MIRRKHHSTEYKEKIVLELISGQSTVTQLAQREEVHPQTLRNWRKQYDSGAFRNSHSNEIALRKRVAELEHALGEMALENHILKKTEKILSELRRKGEL